MSESELLSSPMVALPTGSGQ